MAFTSTVQTAAIYESGSSPAKKTTLRSLFTPFTQVAEEVMFSSYGSEAVSWRVLNTGNVADGCEGCTVLVEGVDLSV